MQIKLLYLYYHQLPGKSLVDQGRASNGIKLAKD